MSCVLIHIVLFIVSFATVRSEWEFQKPVPKGMNLAGIFPDGEIIAVSGLKDPALFSSKDTGRSWTSVKSFDYSIDAFHSYGDSSVCCIYRGYPRMLSISHNRGKTWRNIEIDFLDPGNQEGIFDVFSDPLNRLFLYTSRGIYRSGDSGHTWKEYGTPDGYVRDYYFDKNGVFYLQLSGKLYVQTMEAGPWKLIVPDSVEFFTVSDKGAVFVASDNAILRSINQGKTWETLKQGLEDACVHHASGKDTVLYSSSYTVPPFYTRYNVGLLVNNGGWQEVPCKGISPRHAPDAFTKSRGDLWLTHVAFVCMISRDNGVSWESTASAQGELKYIVAGTGNRLYIGKTTGGVLQSGDGGRTWKNDSRGLDVTNEMESLHADDNGNVFAATIDGIFVKHRGEQQWRLCYGRDFLWGATVVGVSRGNVFAVIRTPENYMLIASGNSGAAWDTLRVGIPFTGVVASETGTLFGISCEHVYRSDNGGYDWTELPAPQIKCAATLHICSGGSLLLSTGGAPEEDSVAYRSDDGGQTWTASERLRGMFISKLRGMADGSVWSIGSATLTSTDCGRTWLYHSREPLDDLVTDSKGRTHGVKDQKVGYTEDATIWEFCFGREKQKITTVVPAPGGLLYAVTDSGEVLVSRNSGDSWTRRGIIKWGESGRYIFSMIALSGNVLLVATPEGMWVSTDGGVNFVLRTVPVLWGIAILKALPDGNFAAITLGGELLTSSDYGESWHKEQGFGATEQMMALDIVVDNSTTYALTTTGVFVKNSLPGADGVWQVRSEVVTLDYSRISMAPDGTLYVYGFNVLRSPDKGTTWAFVKGLPTDYIKAIEFLGDHVLVAASSNLHISADKGSTWTMLNSPNRPLFITSSGEYFVAGESGTILRMRRSPATSVRDDSPIAGGNAMSVAPHPAHGESRVGFALDKTGVVNIDLYTLTGSKVLSLYSGTLPAGEQTIRWNASGLAPGVYLCVLTAEGRRTTQVVVVR